MFASSYAPHVDGHEHLETMLRLPRHFGARALAQSYRETALSFMNDSRHWGKAELAMWLLGPYSQCTKFGALARREAERPLLLTEIDARFVERIIGTARTSVLDVVHSELAIGRIGSFASDMIAAGFVVRCQDEAGVDGWLPTTTPRRLAERVLSLFAADYLTRPASFESELSYCAACRSIDFDARAPGHGLCRRHGSGFFGHDGSSAAFSWFPEGA